MTDKLTKDMKLYQKEYFQRNKDRIRIRDSKRKDEIQKYQKRYRIENKEHLNKQSALYSKEWYKNNRDTIISRRKKYQCEYSSKRFKLKQYDIDFKYKSSIRAKTIRKYRHAKQCQICNKPGMSRYEHHHYTNPYEVDKFVDICTYCHRDVEKYTKMWIY